LNNAKILIVDDEREMLESTEKILRGAGYKTKILSEPEKIKSVLNSERFDLILCDLLMPVCDGNQILELTLNEFPEIPVIIFSAYGTVDRAVACMKHGAFDFLEKPFDGEHLIVVVEKALNFSTVSSERKILLRQLIDKYSAHNLVGRSESIVKIFETIEDVARSDANVLITGESGTGKELIARSIHARGKRRLKEFVPVNCSSFPDSLFEAELFGYEKGAFTGADSKKIGLLEFADGGTFFMDEICELPMNLQAKLLRILQERKLRRLGGNEEIEFDIRLISATNKNIEVQLKKNFFREDFYYRINVINIHVPPLRERTEDIPILAEHFLQTYMTKTQKRIEGFAPEVLSVFENYPWPGNVRELKNVIERALVFAKGKLITISDIPAKIAPSGKTEYDFAKNSIKKLKAEAVAEIERAFIVHVLKKHKGNVTKAAEEMSMTRRNIYRLIKRHNVEVSQYR